MGYRRAWPSYVVLTVIVSWGPFGVGTRGVVFLPCWSSPVGSVLRPGNICSSCQVVRSGKVITTDGLH